jgi:hypothetical protein
VDASGAGPFPRLTRRLLRATTGGLGVFTGPALTVVALTNTAFEGMVGRFTVDVRNAVYGV